MSENEREFFRVIFRPPLIANMTLGEGGKTFVSLIMDLSAGGMRVQSHERLLSREVLLTFNAQLLGKPFELQGTMVRKKFLDGWGIYEYGIEFSVLKNQRDKLLPMLQRLHTIISRGGDIENSSIISVEDLHEFYLKEKV